MSAQVAPISRSAVARVSRPVFLCPIHARARGPHGQVFVRGVVGRMGGTPTHTPSLPFIPLLVLKGRVFLACPEPVEWAPKGSHE